MESYSIALWIIVGIALILLEFTTIPGIGLLFVGLGALTLSVLLYLYPVLFSYQIAAIGIISLAWFIMLWWPLQRYVYKGKPGQGGYFDIVGSEVTVLGDEIKPGGLGQVTWSGTIMNAKLISDEEQIAQIGNKLYIIEAKGNILICSSKKPNIK